MKRSEEIYRELLYQFMEHKERKFTQSGISKNLGISVSMVNYAIKPLRAMNAINVKRRSLTMVDAKKTLYYWASVRNLQKDIIYQTRSNKDVRKIESEMPPDIVYGLFSAYKFMFKDVPSDYSEVYVYSGDIQEIRKRFPAQAGPPNLFVLEKGHMAHMTKAQLFVDLWNVKEWYAKEFLKALEEKIHGLLE
ncbi:MAG: hypothetical protein ABIF10_01095 [Candidatus Woesearchaeota archaeon]